ncbi:MAG TPA: hypothetical protein VM100_02735 [Longimicrobiales bacterium]|nr:hypothetical protein [Longimicrobiales bacterium]
MFGSKKKSGGAFSFRVSDAVEIPGRGFLLRLKLNDGDPAIADLGVGKKIILRSPAGGERAVVIKDHSVTQGPTSQDRLDRTREFDVVIETPDAVVENAAVDIGWTASGPA